MEFKSFITVKAVPTSPVDAPLAGVGSSLLTPPPTSRPTGRERVCLPPSLSSSEEAWLVGGGSRSRLVLLSPPPNLLPDEEGYEVVPRPLELEEVVVVTTGRDGFPGRSNMFDRSAVPPNMEEDELFVSLADVARACLLERVSARSLV